MVLFPIGQKFNRRRSASFANPISSQASDAYVAPLSMLSYVALREVTLNVRFTYRFLVECRNALQY